MARETNQDEIENMMDDETFVIWRPAEGLPSRLYCEGIHDDRHGFRLLLRGEDIDEPIFQLTFDFVYAYRNIDEGDRLRTLSKLPGKGQATLFIVEHSRWLKWFHEESYGIRDDAGLVHYAIYTSDDCIDILATGEPHVETLSSRQSPQ